MKKHIQIGAWKLYTDPHNWILRRNSKNTYHHGLKQVAQHLINEETRDALSGAGEAQGMVKDLKGLTAAVAASEAALEAKLKEVAK